MIQVRLASVEDVQNIGRYNAAMALETEGLTLDMKRLTKGIEAVFEDHKKGFYLVVEVDGTVRGSLMVTKEWSDWRNGKFWWIQSVFVEKCSRNQGLYKSMYNYLLKKVQDSEDVAGIRLYVENDNQVAQETYKNLGMHKTNYKLYEFSNIKLD